MRRSGSGSAAPSWHQALAGPTGGAIRWRALRATSGRAMARSRPERYHPILLGFQSDPGTWLGESGSGLPGPGWLSSAVVPSPVTI
jgi:hypothetical protein